MAVVSDVDEAWSQHLLRVVEERMEGKRLSDEEAAEAHEFAASQAWLREMTEDGEELTTEETPC